jgi:hypothetical protein
VLMAVGLLGPAPRVGRSCRGRGPAAWLVKSTLAEECAARGRDSDNDEPPRLLFTCVVCGAVVVVGAPVPAASAPLPVLRFRNFLKKDSKFF